jgi:hypothetical protein
MANQNCGREAWNVCRDTVDITEFLFFSCLPQYGAVPITVHSLACECGGHPDHATLFPAKQTSYAEATAQSLRHLGHWLRQPGLTAVTATVGGNHSRYGYGLSFLFLISNKSYLSLS